MDINKDKVKVSGSIRLSYPILTKNNYTTWAMKMKVYMQAQGVWVAIESPDPKVPLEDKIDKVALAMMYQGLSEEMLLSIAEKRTAKEAWDSLKTMCRGADLLNGLVSNIKALGDELKESYVVKKLLRAVPSKFLQIVSTLEKFGDLETLSVEEVVGSLNAHEERMKGCGKSESNEGQLLLTEEEWAKRENNEGKLLHTRDEWLKKSNRKGSDGSSSNFRKRGPRDKSNLKCYNCGIYEHFIADCRRSKRNKEEVNMAKFEDDEPALLLTKHDKVESGVKYLSEIQLIPSKMTKFQGDSNV
ncbi:uncharacterized protein LOC141679218 [Apium graveolens]|uniref:uncharacterized protein LOC141679218 n=1 Tax=Apium graveolens TaxID=4045 RepID=UPI003D7AEC39